MTKDWLASLDPQALARARELIGCFEALGAPRPEALARSEVKDNHPQLARFLFLRHCWTETIDAWRDDLVWIDNLIAEAIRDPDGQFADAGMALKRLKDLGADPRDLGLIARFIAYEAVFSVVHTLDEGYDPEHEENLPGWALLERDTVGHVTVGRS